MKLNVKSIVLGFIVDFVATLVMGGILATVYSVMMVRNIMSQGGSPEQVGAMIESFQSPNFLMISLAIGLVCSVLGGYIAGGPETENAIYNATVLAAIMAIFSFLMSGTQFPQWYRLATPLLTFLAVVLGGFFSSLRKAPQPSAAATVSEGNAPPIPLP